MTPREALEAVASRSYLFQEGLDTLSALLESLQQVAHPPFDFTELVERLEALEHTMHEKKLPPPEPGAQPCESCNGSGSELKACADCLGTGYGEPEEGET